MTDVAPVSHISDETPRRPSRSPVRVAARVVRRGWRRLRRRLRGHNVQFVYHTAYERSLPAVPLDSRRAERILAFLADEGLLDRRDLRVPRPPQVRALLRVHDADYLDALQRPDSATRVFGVPIDDAALAAVIEMQRMMVGGTIFATKLAVRERGVVVNLGGGLHHALRDEGMGFCLFNDIAVAVARLRAKGYAGRILVVDLDMHDGNGTRAIFARDPTVHTYSIHAEHWGEPEAVASTAIELGNDVEDELLLGNLLKTLPEVVEAVDPGLAIYVAGADPAADDALGSWRLTPAGMLARDRFVMEQLRGPSREVPVVVLLGGGYGDGAWRYTARLCTYLLCGRAIEPPPNEELLLQRFRRIQRTLDPTALSAEPGPSSWKLTEEDLAGILPEAPQHTRLLAAFSKHGVELMLERLGILDQLRLRGFERPEVVMDLDHPLGQRIRIFGAADRQHLLMELRVNRSSRAVPGFELLVIEWLLLQNPCAHFGPYRQPLPEQNHPGLGMLKDVFGWLVVIAEMLGLDGVYYVPASYHVAAQSRRLVRFLHPEHEAHYRAVKAAVEGLDLAEATLAVSEGRLVDEASGEPVAWEGLPMVLPVSDRLRERVFGEAYEERVAEELAVLHLRLAAPAAVAPDQP